MADDIAKMSFEDALDQLQSIVDRLEKGEIPLEESIDLYQRGAALKKHCEGKLRDAQLKVDKIVLGPDGAQGVEPFDAD